jgi:hypothetical protein
MKDPHPLTNRFPVKILVPRGSCFRPAFFSRYQVKRLRRSHVAQS